MRVSLTLLSLLLLVFASGCGSADSSTNSGASGPGERASADGTLVAALGDSITAGSPLWDPNPAIREAIGAALDERSQFEYWLALDRPGLEFRNCGVLGERTDQIAQRLSECAEGADALIVQGGINDIAQGRPVEDAAADLRAMVETGRYLGLRVALVDVLPWNNGHPAADEPIEQLNLEIERIGAEEDVPVLPFHDTLEDPDEPGVMQAELTNDGNHPSIKGYRLLAQEAFGTFP